MRPPTRRGRSALAPVVLAAVALAPSSGHGQTRAQIAAGSPDAAEVLDGAARVAAVADRAPAGIWPGFRPDTLAVVLSVPEVGWILTGWSGPLPAGFVRIEDVDGLAWRPYRPGQGEEANTISLEGRPWIFYRGAGSRATDLGNAVHEAFHLLQRALRGSQRYPPGENSARVISYPEFDPTNEAGIALEGRLLDGALRALPDTASAAARVREFVAAREARQRRLDPEDALFEIRTELNEGVAQYAYVRALMLAEEAAAAERDSAWARDARAELTAQRQLLADLIGARRQSLRLRFYALGSAQALLLDALTGPSWKERVMAEGAALQDLLADATGYRAEERRLAGAARARHPDLEAAGEAAVEALVRDRRARAEEALAVEGVRIDIDASVLPGGGPNFCGFDPQNLLQVGESRLLHARWYRVCSPGFDADLNVPVVHDWARGTLALVVPDDDLSVLVDGEAIPILGNAAPFELTGTVEIRADGVEIRAERGRLTAQDGGLRLVVEADD